MTAPGVGLLLLGVTLAVGVAGVRVLYLGWAQRAETMERARLNAGDRTRRRMRGAIEQRLRTTRFGRWLELRLAASGVDLGITDFLGIAAVAGLGGYLAAELIFPRWLSVASALLAVRGCGWWLDRRRAQRREEFVSQLPDLARVLSNCSSAGLSLRSAIDMAAAELDEPAAAELATVADELRLGQPIDLALERMQERLPSREVGVLVATLVIQQRAGGDLVRSLRDMADTLENRKDLRREVRTIMAGSVFTSYVVAVLGAGTLLLLNGMSPGIIEDMTRSWIGRFALVVGSSLYALGFFLIRRTTRIET